MIMSRSTSHVYDPPAGEGDARETHQPLPLVFNREGVRAVDREAVEHYGIPGIVLMENAARGLCLQAVRMVRHAAATPRVLIVCGSGNNGGDGYALGRLLHNCRIDVTFAAVGRPRPGTDAALNLAICHKMNLREIDVHHLDQFARDTEVHLVVDAIFGTGLDRPVSGQAVDVINWINAAGLPVLAVDVPSGLDCDTGAILGAALKATRTVTFVGLKVGFTGLDAQKLLGVIVVADIGAPRELVEMHGTRMEMPHPEVPEHEPESALHVRRRRS